MIRSSLYSPDDPAPGGFTLRGKEVSRLEAFSDAAFGFALTLLVVSLEVPATFAEMLDRMRGVVAFAICFGILVWIWRQHFVFFRRYGLSDIPTFLLNAALLFVVLLYVYPLKFLFTLMIAGLTGLGPASVIAAGVQMQAADFRHLFEIFGIGWFAVCSLFALMHAHALSRRAALGLSAMERHMTMASVVESTGLGAVGLLSCTLATALPAAWLSCAGWAYFLCAPVGMVVGMWMGARKPTVSPKNQP